MHPSITAERVIALVEEGTFGLASPGLCLVCGEDADGVEPDARCYRCASCGRHEVYGAEEILFMVGEPL